MFRALLLTVLLSCLPAVVMAQGSERFIGLMNGADSPYYLSGEIEEIPGVDRFEVVFFGSPTDSTARGVLFEADVQKCEIFLKFSSSKSPNDSGESTWMFFASVGPSLLDCDLEIEDQQIVMVLTEEPYGYVLSLSTNAGLSLIDLVEVPPFEVAPYQELACKHTHWIPLESDGLFVVRNVANFFECHRGMAISLFQSPQLILLPDARLNFSEGRMVVEASQEIEFYSELRERAGQNNLRTEEIRYLTSAPNPYSITCLLEPGAQEGENSAYYATLRSLERSRVIFDCVPYES